MPLDYQTYKKMDFPDETNKVSINGHTLSTQSYHEKFTKSGTNLENKDNIKK